MTNRERLQAILHYESYDWMPLVHFGFWKKTLESWAEQGHIGEEEAGTWTDGNPSDASIGAKLGFDFNWNSMFMPELRLYPAFETRVVRRFPDGSCHVFNSDGVVELQRDGVVSIGAEIEHTLVDRRSWEEHYRRRFQFSEERIEKAEVRVGDTMIPFAAGGAEYLRSDSRDESYGLHCGSLLGHIRNVLGVQGLSYLQVDDEPLLDEILETVTDLTCRVVDYVLQSGAKFDFAHFWEDICFKNGPLVSPKMFKKKLVPRYKRVTEILRQYGIDIISVDCDGLIDLLVPAWLEGGVNTMFPIEVGTWGASIKPWRERYGRQLRGVGGVNKRVFSQDKNAIDEEIERLVPLVKLRGYIPCPDHRLPPESKWEMVQYYCRRMREVLTS